MNRRELLRSVGLLLGYSSMSRLASATELQSAAVPRTNWSGNLRYSTDNVYARTTAEESATIVRANPKIKALGSRHCFNDIADSTHAQISMRAVKGIKIDAAKQTVTVGAGTAYGELAPVLDQAGFALANLASLPHISVGGTIATATHGSGVGNQNLATAVQALRLVKADGSVLPLSRADDPAHFPLAVVHLGALGVVTEVTLGIVPRFDMSQVVYENLSFDQLEKNLDAIMGTAYSVSLFTDWQHNRATQVWIKRKVNPNEAEKPTLVPEFYGATLQKVKLHPAGQSAEPCTDQMGSIGPWYLKLPHFKMEFTPSTGRELQTEYFVPRSEGYRAMRAVEQLRDRITPLLYITEIRTIASDQMPMSMHHGRESLAIHFTWKPDEPAVRQLLPTIEAALKPFGVRPHWGKIFEIDPTYLHSQYPQLEQFRALAAEFDPTGKFRNKYLERNIFS
jgi:alditol oxidase